MPKFLLPCWVLLLVLSIGCAAPSETARATAEAFVGPASLPLYQDLAPGSPVSATLSHGQRVDIIGRRRKFVQVRTPTGEQGWTDSYLLLTPLQMKELRDFIVQAARLPSQGRATVYDPLNVHTEPNRQAPTIYQIPAGGSVEVLAHKLAPRVPYRPPRPPSRREPPKTRPKKSDKKEVIQAPPPPPGPPLPENWLDLSGYVPKPEPPPPPKPAVAMDDWNLVRARSGLAGWVLRNMLTMAIPDEVAQYAEGHRITSYFSLGEVRDGDQVKHNWLWTTLSQRAQPYQFDSFRVFVWSVRRHRYETAYIERNLKGYYPVEVSRSQNSEPPRFSLLIEDKDGQLQRRDYAFQGYRVRLVDKQPATLPPPVDARPAPAPTEPGATSPVGDSWLSELKRRWDSWRSKLFHR